MNVNENYMVDLAALKQCMCTETRRLNRGLNETVSLSVDH